MKYIPASSFAVLNLTGKDDRKLYSEYHKSPNWWEPNSFFKHNTMLITAFYGMNDPDFREKYRIPRKGFELMGDSGGFQQYKGDRGLDPLKVHRWQEHNCDIGFSLDFPLLSSDDMRLVRAKNKINIKNINDMIQKRENHDMGFYACTHGWTEQQIRDVHKQLPHDQIDGWGIGECSASDDTPIGIMRRIALESTLNVNKKRMHILGCCSPIMIGFLALVEEKEGIPISYDSTAYSNGAMYRWYHIDGEKRDKYRITANEEKISENHRQLDEAVVGEIKPIPAGEIEELSCDCPVCTQSNFQDMLGSDSEAGTLISLHNMYKEVQLNDKYTKMAQEGTLIDHLQEKFDNWKYRKMIKVIRDYYRMDTQDFVKTKAYKNKYYASRTGNLDIWTGDDKPVQILKAKKQFEKPKTKKKKAVKKEKKKENKVEEKEQEITEEYFDV